MSKVYVWYSIQECLPDSERDIEIDETEQESEWQEVECHEQNNLRFLEILNVAMCSGALNVYDSEGSLQSPPKDVGLTHYLYPDEVNKWFKANDLPYIWSPTKKIEKPPVLKHLLPELKLAAIQSATYLRAKGSSESTITPLAVAEELVRLTDWKSYKPSTLENKIRVSWWKKTSR